jgi:hypothetical protein
MLADSWARFCSLGGGSAASSWCWWWCGRWCSTGCRAAWAACAACSISALAPRAVSWLRAHEQPRQRGRARRSSSAGQRRAKRASGREAQRHRPLAPAARCLFVRPRRPAPALPRGACPGESQGACSREAHHCPEFSPPTQPLCLLCRPPSGTQPHAWPRAHSPLPPSPGGPALAAGALAPLPSPAPAHQTPVRSLHSTGTPAGWPPQATCTGGTRAARCTSARRRPSRRRARTACTLGGCAARGTAGTACCWRPPRR